MDSYLAMAQRVLQATRQPMTPREILRQAYRDHLVPTRLYGKTQHKTLQARLSENILRFRDRSVFFRTAPGRFFLRAFLSDPSIPLKYRQPIVARRRLRELRRRDVLMLSAEKEAGKAEFGRADNDLLRHAVERGTFEYRNMADRNADEMAVWSFVVVQRDTEILTYRQGRYREDRDSFMQRRCVGFYAPVIRNDMSLFDRTDLGLVAGGLQVLAMDLDLVGDPVWTKMADGARLKGFLVAESGDDKHDLLGLVQFTCPDWFEPVTQRLAINELMWHDLGTPVNHLEDFDPWSREILQIARQWVETSGHTNEATARNY